MRAQLTATSRREYDHVGSFGSGRAARNRLQDGCSGRGRLHGAHQRNSLKKKYLNGQTAGYGRIFAAEYENAGKKYQALLFHDPAARPVYYAADGKSLQKAFLRSPLKFGAPVTSHFSRSRFHPILKICRPHMGSAYGAPVGTPVQTIGSGRVISAGRKGGEGNMVHIAHFKGYETRYLHLSRMFVHAGEHGETGKTIGLVGSSGLARGPHLD